MPEHQQTQKSTESKSTVKKQATPRIQAPISHPMAIIQRARMNPKSLTPADILQLQRTIGNRAVGRLLSEIGLIPSKAKQAPPVQRQEIPEEEENPLQGKIAEPIQRQEIPDEEEPLQGKMSGTIQRQEIPEEENPLQGKFESVTEKEICSSCMQRQEIPDEDEPVQGKMTGTIQCQEEEELLQTKKENNTGMPDNLKAGVESLSGIDISDIRVHYNSSKPAEIGALAYTQGTDIHVAPGQERHLPHEAWHVLQQAQGRVKPTMQLKDGVPVNNDEGLEHEADVMGAKASASREATIRRRWRAGASGAWGSPSLAPADGPVQRVAALMQLGDKEVWYDDENMTLGFFPTKEALLRAMRDQPVKLFDVTGKNVAHIREVLGMIPAHSVEPDEVDSRWVEATLEAMRTEAAAECTVTGSLEESDQDHHPYYSFDIGGSGDRKKYDLDRWTTKKDPSPPAHDFIRQQGVSPERVLRIVSGWNCDDSIVHALANYLVASQPIADWKNSSIKLEVKATEEGRKMVMQLLAMKENIVRREADIPNNCVTKLMISTITKPSKQSRKTECTINWAQVLKESRNLLRKALMDRQLCPSTKEEVWLVEEAIRRTPDNGLRMLQDMQLLSSEMKFKKKSVVGRNTYSAEIVEPSDQGIIFNFGINHLRFILYMEWRMVSELMGQK